MTPSDQILFRDPTEQDIPFLLNSWLKSAREVGDRAAMNNATYFGGFRDECILKMQRGFVTIACDSEDPDHIYGWVCYDRDPDTLHYCYVKHPFRLRGLAKSLVSSAIPLFGEESTKVTSVGKFHRDWASKYKLEYDPFSWQKKQ